MRQTEDTRKKQTEINKEISKAKSAEGEQVSKGVFGGKVNKNERVTELEAQLAKTTSNLDSLSQIRAVAYNILNNVEFPRIVVTINITVDAQEQSDV